MALTSARRVPLSDVVAQQLRAALQSGEYPAGTKLPTEAELSHDLNVGRTTVREAIRALVSEGMLVSRQGSGVYATGEISLARRLSTAALVEVFHARCAIEVYAAGLACAHRDDDDLVRLDEALRHRDEIPARTREFAERDIAVHRAIVAAAHNTVLLDVYVELEPRLVDAFIDSRFLDIAPPEQAAEHLEAHYAVVQAIRDRDTARAEHLTRLMQVGAIAALEAMR